MKKFYETPAVEFTGFNAEDVITTSAFETYDAATGTTNAEAAATLKGYVADGKIQANATVDFGSYQW